MRRWTSSGESVEKSKSDRSSDRILCQHGPLSGSMTFAAASRMMRPKLEKEEEVSQVLRSNCMKCCLPEDVGFFSIFSTHDLRCNILPISLSLQIGG